ncbi:uncharacterized protein ACB058_020018 isoform 1-T1 [Synchiropus picturatus]
MFQDNRESLGRWESLDGDKTSQECVAGSNTPGWCSVARRLGALGGASVVTWWEKENRNRAQHLQSSRPTCSFVDIQPCRLTSASSYSSRSGLRCRTEAELSGAASPPRVRTKRCACSSLLDSECHYFCHLDIIWINTPSKTTVYGLGSTLSRRRRSASRCACANPDDLTCTSFCQHRPKVTAVRNTAKSQPSLLKILRDVAKRRLQAATDSEAQNSYAGRR